MTYFPTRIKVQFTDSDHADTFETALNLLLNTANKVVVPNDHGYAVRPSSNTSGGEYWVLAHPGLVAISDAESLKDGIEAELADQYYDTFIATALSFEHIDHDNQESGWQVTA